MKHSRNSFVEFNNQDVWEEGRKSLDRRIKRRKFIRNISLLTFIATIIIIFCIFLRPDLFSLLSFSKISKKISTLYPSHQEDDLPVFRLRSENSTASIVPPHPEYSFTKDQVDKVQNLLLSKSRNVDSNSVYLEKTIELQKEENFRYEIELMSGRRFYSETASIENNIISFEDTKGIVISLDKKDIKSINLIKASKKKDR